MQITLPLYSLSTLDSLEGKFRLRPAPLSHSHCVPLRGLCGLNWALASMGMFNESFSGSMEICRSTSQPQTTRQTNRVFK